MQNEQMLENLKDAAEMFCEANPRVTGADAFKRKVSKVKLAKRPFPDDEMEKASPPKVTRARSSTPPRNT